MEGNMKSLIELQKNIDEKKKILNLSVENDEPQDVLYQKSIDTDEAIAEYMIHTLYQFCKSMNIHADDLLFGGNVEENNYSDKEIIENIIQKCDEKQLKIIKDVLIAMFSNFNELIK